MTKNEYIATKQEEYVRQGESFADALKHANRDWANSGLKSSRDGYGTRNWLFERLREGRMSDGEWEEFLEVASKNLNDNKVFFKKIVDLANGIRDDLEG